MAASRGSLLTREGEGSAERAAPTMPLIGVTTSEVREAKDVSQTHEGEPPRHEMALGLTYMRTIEKAGGVPVVLPPLGPDAINPLLDQVAGLCLSGGPDLDPKTYAQQAVPELGPTWPELDFVEIAVARGADQRDMPLLAICRGMQALNVARGGSLHQHLRRGRDRPPPSGEARRWRPTRSGSTRRAGWPRSSARRSIRVNSFHHQAIDELGEGLRAVAWAPDGVIEAVEATERDEFLIGVQWHAECLSAVDGQLSLFQAFTNAAAGRLKSAG